MKQLFLVLSVFSAAVAVAEKQSFERYQPIVDRQMFGAPPLGFDPMKLPSEVAKGSSRGKAELTQEQARLQSSVHFSVINVAADGTPVVGFSDNSDPKAPVHHYLKVGEESGGWKVLSADLAESSMTIEKDGVQLTLKLGDNSGKSAGNGGASAVPAVASAHGSRRRSGLLGLGTLGSRRAQREKMRLEQQAAEKKRQEDERLQREQHEREREHEREQNRQQLQALQESLRQLRESQNAAKADAENGDETDENNNAQ